eukprot:jgi/Botrbrau1/5806/Bobra.0155s0028.1
MEVAKPDAASSPSTTEAETYRRDDDPIVIPAHVFNPPPKITVEAEFEDLKKYLLTPELSNQPENLLWQFLHADSGIDTHGNIDSALQKYVALLLGLVNRGPAKGTASDTPLLETKIGADSKLRSSVTFTWQDVLQVNKEAVAARDGLFELASLLVSSGVWRMRRAYDLCSAQPAAVAADAAAQAHKMLRSAAGNVFHSQQRSAPTFYSTLFRQWTSILRWCSLPLSILLLTSATVEHSPAYPLCRFYQGPLQKAMPQSWSPSWQPTPLNCTARQRMQAGELYRPRALPPATSPAPSALTAYANWKALAFDAYAYAFAGQSLMVEKSEARNQAGRAVRLLEEALSKLAAATQACPTPSPRPAAPAVPQTMAHSTAPSSPVSKLRMPRSSGRMTSFIIKRSQPICRRYRQAVGWWLQPPTPFRQSGSPLKRACSDCLAWTRLLSPLRLLGLCGPAAGGKPGEAAGKPAGGGGGRGRASLVLAMAACHNCGPPILVIISLVGAIVWLVLLPVKIVCCPIGCAAQLVWNAVEWGLKGALPGASVGLPESPGGPQPPSGTALIPRPSPPGSQACGFVYSTSQPCRLSITYLKPPSHRSRPKKGEINLNQIWPKHMWLLGLAQYLNLQKAHSVSGARNKSAHLQGLNFYVQETHLCLLSWRCNPAFREAQIRRFYMAQELSYVFPYAKRDRALGCPPPNDQGVVRASARTAFTARPVRAVHSMATAKDALQLGKCLRMHRTCTANLGKCLQMHMHVLQLGQTPTDARTCTAAWQMQHAWLAVRICFKFSFKCCWMQLQMPKASFKTHADAVHPQAPSILYRLHMSTPRVNLAAVFRLRQVHANVVFYVLSGGYAFRVPHAGCKACGEACSNFQDILNVVFASAPLALDSMYHMQDIFRYTYTYRV